MLFFFCPLSLSVNEILSTAAKERPEGLASPQEGKSCKGIFLSLDMQPVHCS